MEPQTVTIAVDAQTYKVALALLNLLGYVAVGAACWFLGQWYKVRRLKGLNRDEILQQLGVRAREIIDEGQEKVSDVTQLIRDEIKKQLGK